MGVRVQDLTEQLGEYFGVPEGRGVLVTFVRAGSPAERAGLRAGDVIIAVDDTDVRNVREFTRVLMRKEGEVSLTIVRNKERQKITVPLERRERPRGWFYDQGDLLWDAYLRNVRDYVRELQRYVELLERYEQELRRRGMPTTDPYRRLISTFVL